MMTSWFGGAQGHTHTVPASPRRSAVQMLRPTIGMQLTFTTSASAELAGIPAEVVDIWPRFRSGNYLVTLEYTEPVRMGKEIVRRIDAFISELEVPVAHGYSPRGSRTGS